jgi:hypothetical protein
MKAWKVERSECRPGSKKLRKAWKEQSVEGCVRRKQGRLGRKKGVMEG